MHAAGLIVPLRKVAYRISLHGGCVNPVDKRPADTFIRRPGCPHDENRRTVDIGVIDRERSVEQANHVVDNRDHRLTRCLRVTMGHLNRNFLVVADHHRRIVFAVIDQ